MNAGHEYPALQTGGEPFVLRKDAHCKLVGVLGNARYTEYEIRLKPGDRLFLYTDGVPEARTADESMFGLDRMIEALNAEAGAPPERVVRNVRNAVDGFTRGAEQFDDLSMLCLEYRGKPEKPAQETAAHEDSGQESSVRNTEN